MPRLFYALWPDEGTREALAAAAMQLDIRDGRWVRPENLHLTLQFLGDVDPAVEGALRAREGRSEVAAFDFELADAGWWRGSRVAWLAPMSAPIKLEALVAELALFLPTFGLTAEERVYRPHVTVARKVRRAPRVSGSIEISWHVEDFVLVASRTEAAGARYEVLERWPLGADGTD